MRHGQQESLHAFDDFFSTPGFRRLGLVFLVPLTPVGIGALINELRGIIDERADDIRVYPLPSRVEVAQYGLQGLPDGIDLVGGQLGGEKIAALSARRRWK